MVQDPLHSSHVMEAGVHPHPTTHPALWTTLTPMKATAGQLRGTPHHPLPWTLTAPHQVAMTRTLCVGVQEMGTEGIPRLVLGTMPTPVDKDHLASTSRDLSLWCMV